MNTAIALLRRYNFDLGEQSLEDLLAQWDEYDPSWVRMAVIECLYRGRYKAISVSQLLQCWIRRQDPYCQFNHEFERLVCKDSAHILSSELSTEQYDQAISKSFTPIDHSYSPSLALITKLKSFCQG